jgi:hypothetical protein
MAVAFVAVLAVIQRRPLRQQLHESEACAWVTSGLLIEAVSSLTAIRPKPRLHCANG